MSDRAERAEDSVAAAGDQRDEAMTKAIGAEVHHRAGATQILEGLDEDDPIRGLIAAVLYAGDQTAAHVAATMYLGDMLEAVVEAVLASSSGEPHDPPDAAAPPVPRRPPRDREATA